MTACSADHGGVPDITQPAPALITSADDTRVPVQPYIVDDQLRVWTLGPSHEVLRDGALVVAPNLDDVRFKSYAAQILWRQRVIYVVGLDDLLWWRWTGVTWVIEPYGPVTAVVVS